MLEFYFRFWFLHRHVVLHLPTKFRPNRTIGDRIMTWYAFFKMAATPLQFYFRFRFSWLCLFGKLEIYVQSCTPNFGEISQSRAEILLLSVSENKRPPCWNSTSGSIFTFASPSACHSVYQISSKLDRPRHRYDIISIFQDGGRQLYWIITVCTVCRTVVRVVRICIGNATFGGAPSQTPVNESTWNLAGMITLGMRVNTLNGISVGSGAWSPRRGEMLMICALKIC